MDWKKKGVIDMYDFTEVVVHIKNMEILENINICFMLQAGKRGTEAPDPAEQNGAATRTTDSANLLYPHPQRQCQV